MYVYVPNGMPYQVWLYSSTRVPWYTVYVRIIRTSMLTTPTSVPVAPASLRPMGTWERWMLTPWMPLSPVAVVAVVSLLIPKGPSLAVGVGG